MRIIFLLFPSFSSLCLKHWSFSPKSFYITVIMISIDWCFISIQLSSLKAITVYQGKFRYSWIYDESVLLFTHKNFFFHSIFVVFALSVNKFDIFVFFCCCCYCWNVLIRHDNAMYSTSNMKNVFFSRFGNMWMLSNISIVYSTNTLLFVSCLSGLFIIIYSNIRGKKCVLLCFSRDLFGVQYWMLFAYFISYANHVYIFLMVFTNTNQIFWRQPVSINSRILWNDCKKEWIRIKVFGIYFEILVFGTRSSQHTWATYTFFRNHPLWWVIHFFLCLKKLSGTS